MSRTMVLRPLELEGEDAKRAAEVMKAVRTVLNSQEMRRKEQARVAVDHNAISSKGL